VSRASRLVCRVDALQRRSVPHTLCDVELQALLLGSGVRDIFPQAPRNAYDAVVIADQDVPGVDGDPGAADGDLRVDGVMPCEVDAAPRTCDEHWHAKTAQRLGIADAAIGHVSDSSTHHQPGEQDFTHRADRAIPARIGHEYVTSRDRLDRGALSVTFTSDRVDRVDVLPARDQAQSERLPDELRGVRIYGLDPGEALIPEAAPEQLSRDRGSARDLQGDSSLRA
jgi:hypothetical protein